jgi:hypothetical protein
MAGKKFDERTVEAFCRVYAAGRIELPKRYEEGSEPDPSFPSGPFRTPAAALASGPQDLSPS